jgi:hypothetical protein
MIETAIVKGFGDPDNVLRCFCRSACVYTVVPMDLRLGIRDCDDSTGNPGLPAVSSYQERFMVALCKSDVCSSYDIPNCRLLTTHPRI